MKLKDRIKSKAFWAGLIGTVFLILGAFGVEIGDDTVSTAINAVCSLLVMIGVVSSPAHDDADVAENADCETDDGDVPDGIAESIAQTLVQNKKEQ